MFKSLFLWLFCKDSKIVELILFPSLQWKLPFFWGSWWGKYLLGLYGALVPSLLLLRLVVSHLYWEHSQQISTWWVSHIFPVAGRYGCECCLSFSCKIQYLPLIKTMGTVACLLMSQEVFLCLPVSVTENFCLFTPRGCFLWISWLVPLSTRSCEWLCHVSDHWWSRYLLIFWGNLIYFFHGHWVRRLAWNPPFYDVFFVL